MDDRFEALAELAVHGANVQPGQVVGVAATIGQEELARAVAAAAYRRGALFVDVAYFDPYVKRARIEHADPDTLEFVPPWYGARMLERSASADAPGSASAASSAPTRSTGLDPALLGRDQLPWLKETAKRHRRALDELDDRRRARIRSGPSSSTPSSTAEEAYERLWERALARAAARRARPGGGVGRARRRAAGARRRR